jgi:O-antigen/teichoic acid export membrane protein
MLPLFRSLRPLVHKIVAEGIGLAWLLTDQGIFAFTNFLTNILFARWLTAGEYGMFAVSFSGYLLLTVFHFGTVLEPLLVQSARVEPTRLRSYIVVLIVAHLLLICGVATLAVIAYTVAEMLHVPTIGMAILGAAIGGSFMVTLLTARRLCLVFLSTRVSAVIGVVYMVGVVGTTYLIHRSGEVAWFDLWLVMGGWSLLCSVLIFALLYAAVAGTQPYSMGELVRFQWRYARYGLAAAICSWFRVDGVMLLLARHAGLEVVGETRAVMNIANPAMQIVIAVSTSWLVSFSRDPSRTRLWKTLLVFSAGACLICLGVYAVHVQLVQWIYGGRYLSGAWMLPFYFVLQWWHGTESVFTCFLKAAGSLRRGYTPQIVGAAVAITVGAILIPSIQEQGFVIAILASSAVGATLAFSLSRVRQRPVYS